ncbi:hypothetical protein SAMN05444714_2131 [Yoonia litorea]|uniref:Uncharacterized protein n=1 Tax=Yoonia litorea TaxID=1123755 RepID=A0A1I6MU71_9RHOB|nr:hypothetical protein SAMN05444714_2131 [Yoonia litorea]
MGTLRCDINGTKPIEGLFQRIVPVRNVRKLSLRFCKLMPGQRGQSFQGGNLGQMVLAFCRIWSANLIAAATAL